MLVFAPGQELGLGDPLLGRTCDKLADRGVTCLRFDWGYRGDTDEPSPGLLDEREDLATALAHARAHLGAEHLVLAGRAMGAELALDYCQEPGFAGLVFVGAPLHDEGDPSLVRLAERRVFTFRMPVVFVTGHDDPFCHPKALYTWGARCTPVPHTVVVPANHDLAGDRVARVIVESVATWIASWVKARPTLPPPAP